jgi:hypothetical protein
VKIGRQALALAFFAITMKAPKHRPDDGSGSICGWDSQVVLFNDDVNTFEHVIDCLMVIFGHGRQLAAKTT